MLTASTGNTCQTVTDTMTTTLHRLPSAIVSVANELCLGDSTQLFFSMSGLAPYTVVFDNGETRNIPSSPWLEWVKPSINTTYTLQSVTDVNGCINNTQVSTSVQIKQLPTLNLVADTMLCGNLTLILSANAQGAVAYLWTPGNFTTPSISVDTAGIGLGSHTYTLVATGSNGCKTSSSSIANFINCTGIDEMVGNVMFNIYPNPNNGRFAVEFKSKNNEQVNIKVANPLGEEVYSIGNLKVDGNLKKEFDLRKLAQGTYLLILENNKIQITKQLSIVK